MAIKIGSIGNYYGCLSVYDYEGKTYWGIEDWDATHWEEIPKYLYEALLKFNEESEHE